MGATSNSSSRIAALQERRKQIEDILAKRNQELRELCIQEAEITGITPSEMPLEVGGTPPRVRRIVGTTFQLPENLVQNSSDKDELIQSLELQIQVHSNLAEAALGLANEQNVSKTIKKQHKNEYQKHKNQCITLQEKLAFIKEKQLAEPIKQRKKPRGVEVLTQHQIEGHNSFTNNNNNSDSRFNPDMRHSMRYMKTSDPNDQTMEYYRFSEDLRRYPRPNSELPYPTQQRYDDIFSGIYSLSLNGYNKYMERRENFNNIFPKYDPNLYHYNHDQFQHTNSFYVSQHTSQFGLQAPHHKISPQNHVQMHNLYFSQKSPQHHSHQTTQTKYLDYSNQYNNGSISYQKIHQYTHSLHGQSDYKQNYPNDAVLMNSHQIQPHQQYEHTTVINSGLGGCWRKNERGELVWSTTDVIWQKDKRFGSLDRRKNKRITKISANVDNKSATLGGIPSIKDLNNVPLNPTQVISRKSADRQLVRTQSLGSVGAQTLDTIYPSDDNSSCGSERRNRSNSHTMQKYKTKEWVETALDSPISSGKRQSPSNFNSVPLPSSSLTPEEQYTNNTAPQVNQTSPNMACSGISKPLLEIPAESNPLSGFTENNAKLFNSPINIQNFTIVQEGQCKPYHEETKPFEMSDFYKYSTKFKKANSDQGNIKSFEQDIEQNMNQTYSPKRFHNSPSNVSLLDNAQYVNTGIEHINANHVPTDLRRWYDQQPNTPDNNTEGRFPDTLV